jgi:knotted carbamoyltransferase YgeW
MAEHEIDKLLDALKAKRIDVYQKDYLLTWEKTRAEIEATLLVADALRVMREANLSPRVWDSGIAVSNFRDNSTRTRISYASACDMLGLSVHELDEAKSQIAHGETVRETATMISFLTEAIGIRDDMYLGEGDKYQREVGRALDEGLAAGILPARPTVINLQSDIDHPTQSLADLLHMVHCFGGLDGLKGKRIAMTWAYSPSYGKPLSVPQGIIGLASRFGMDIVLAHPEGYDLMPGLLELAAKQAEKSGGSFKHLDSIDEAFRGADIVYPKSWAPYDVMQKRTPLLHNRDQAGLKDLERECLENNAKFKEWECNEDKMRLTKDGKGLYMHCLPADISDVSCRRGEVATSVFNRYREDAYREASYKPYVIAAMIFLGRIKDPAAVLAKLLDRATRRFVG